MSSDESLDEGSRGEESEEGGELSHFVNNEVPLSFRLCLMALKSQIWETFRTFGLVDVSSAGGTSILDDDDDDDDE